MVGTSKFVDSWSEAPVAWNPSSLAGVWSEGSSVGHCALSPGSPLTAGAGVRVAQLGPAHALAPQYPASAGPAPLPNLRKHPAQGASPLSHAGDAESRAALRGEARARAQPELRDGSQTVGGSGISPWVTALF